MTKTRKIIIISACLMMLVPLTALAFTVKNNETVSVAKDEVIEGNLYVAGSNITVDGKINGDLFCAGSAINISGEVTGDVICAGQSINVSGKVGGNLRVAASSVNLSGSVGRNLMIAAASLNTGASSTIGWEALFATASADLRGKIGRDLTGAGASVNLAGEIGRDVKLWLDRKDDKGGLKIEKSAKINGKLTYTSKLDAEITGGATIVGEIKRNEPKIPESNRRDRTFGWLFGTLFSVFSALVVGLVLIHLFPDETKTAVAKLTEKTKSSFGWGFVVLILVPIICFLLLFTIIGIPLAFLLLLTWVLALVISKIVVSMLVGQRILERFWLAKKDSLFAAMVFGVIVSYLIFKLPFIGPLASFLALIWGLGAIYLFFKKT